MSLLFLQSCEEVFLLMSLNVDIEKKSFWVWFGRVTGGKNNLLIHSGGWWGFNPTDCCSLLKLSNEQKKERGCSGACQLLHHIAECTVLVGIHGACQGRVCKRWRPTVSPRDEGAHPDWRGAVRHEFEWGLPPSQRNNWKPRLLVTLSPPASLAGPEKLFPSSIAPEPFCTPEQEFWGEFFGQLIDSQTALSIGPDLTSSHWT